MINEISSNHLIEQELAELPDSAKGKVVLKVDGLYKKFCRNLKRSMIYGMSDLAKGFLGIRPKTDELRKDEFWALQDINFELRENEILGIIGANGSGKSTLLRVLTGIFPPDKGSVWMDGKVGGIIALGAGMHPHMTGRENIYLNGTILGMSKKEIEEKFDEIVDFAELGEFLEAPLSTYSSGMKVRLGFAVAVHCQPEILLVDEVLAVGDLSFQNKCLRKLKEIRESAKAVIFISHSMENIERICNRVIVMDKSMVLYDGEVSDGTEMYQNRQQESTHYSSNKLQNRKDGIYNLSEVFIESINQTIGSDYLSTRDDLTCEIIINNTSNELKQIILTIAIRDNSLNNLVWYVSTDNKAKPYITLNTGQNRIKVNFGIIPFSNGKYHFVSTIRDKETLEVLSKNNSRNNYLSIINSPSSRAQLATNVTLHFND